MPISAMDIRLLTGQTMPSSSNNGPCVGQRSSASSVRLPPQSEAPTVARCRCLSPVSVHHCRRERHIGCRCSASLAPSTSGAELHGAPALRAGEVPRQIRNLGWESGGARIGRSCGRYVRYSSNVQYCIARRALEFFVAVLGCSSAGELRARYLFVLCRGLLGRGGHLPPLPHVSRRVFFDSRNVQKRATKSDTSGHCLQDQGQLYLVPSWTHGVTTRWRGGTPASRWAAPITSSRVPMPLSSV